MIASAKVDKATIRSQHETYSNGLYLLQVNSKILISKLSNRELHGSRLEEILASAENVCIQIRVLILQFDKNFVINMDQRSWQYQSTFSRTLAHKGSKAVLVIRWNTNKVTRLYTAQYALIWKN